MTFKMTVMERGCTFLKNEEKVLNYCRFHGHLSRFFTVIKISVFNNGVKYVVLISKPILFVHMLFSNT